MNKFKNFWRKLFAPEPEVTDEDEFILKPSKEPQEWAPTPVQVPNDLILTEHFDRDLGLAWFEPALSTFIDHSPLDWLRYRAAIARFLIDEDLKLEVDDSEGTTNGIRRKGEYSINGSHSFTEQEALIYIFAYADGARDMKWKLKDNDTAK